MANKHTSVPSPKDQTFKLRPFLSTKKEHLVLGEENKHPNCAIDSEDRTFQLKFKTFKSKINPEDGDFIKGLYICSFVINIRDCTQII